MLYYSERRLIPVNVNMVVLQGNDGAYYYAHRSLYDQAVILSDRYENNLGTLQSLIGISQPTDAMEIFYDVAPKPINILGYFIAMVDSYSEIPDDTEVMCGIIHVMSKVLNLRKIINIPKETRASMSFSLSVVDEYQLSWDAFFQESIPYSDELFLLGANAYIGNSATVQQPDVRKDVIEQKENTELVDEKAEERENMVEEFSEEDWDAFWNDPDKIAAFLGESEEDTSDEIQQTEEKPVEEIKEDKKDDVFSLLSQL